MKCECKLMGCLNYDSCEGKPEYIVKVLTNETTCAFKRRVCKSCLSEYKLEWGISLIVEKIFNCSCKDAIMCKVCMENPKEAISF